MTDNDILGHCTALILTFSNKPNLTEYEMLAYEQSCRAVEDILRDVRVDDSETDIP